MCVCVYIHTHKISLSICFQSSYFASTAKSYMPTYICILCMQTFKILKPEQHLLRGKKVFCGWSSPCLSRTFSFIWKYLALQKTCCWNVQGPVDFLSMKHEFYEEHLQGMFWSLASWDSRGSAQCLGKLFPGRPMVERGCEFYKIGLSSNSAECSHQRWQLNLYREKRLF